MLPIHEHYEELCALAASGQLTPGQGTELGEHLETCSGCRGFLVNLQITAQALLEIADKQVQWDVPAGMTERFTARARSAGLPLQTPPLQDGAVPSRIKEIVRFPFAKWGALAATIALVFFSVRWLTVHTGTAGPAQPSPVAAVPAAASSPGDLGVGKSTTGDLTDKSPLRENANLKQQLRTTEARLDSATAKLQADQKHLESANRDNAEMASRLAALEGANADLRKGQSDRDTQLGQLKEQLDKQRENDRVLALLQEAELNALRNKASERESEFADAKRLLSASSDVRDLVTARNLHIIDVHDYEGPGKQQRAFGRIFYVEGQSLVFYAYDLADPDKINSKIAFHAWGERLGAERQPHSLGVFRAESPSDGRWVLTFTDPKVLARIDTVFVTAESDARSLDRPKGKRVLYAFLNREANHP